MAEYKCMNQYMLTIEAIILPFTRQQSQSRHMLYCYANTLLSNFGAECNSLIEIAQVGFYRSTTYMLHVYMQCNFLLYIQSSTFPDIFH